MVLKPQLFGEIRKLKPAEAGYIAGMIDGEGWIGIMLKKEKSRNRHRMQPVIHITNSNKNSLIHIQKLIGYGSVVLANNGALNRKTTYRYTLFSKKRILNVLTQLDGLLVIKKPVADLLTHYCKKMWSWHHIDEEDIKIYWKMRELNKRGTQILQINSNIPIQQGPKIRNASLRASARTIKQG